MRKEEMVRERKSNGEQSEVLLQSLPVKAKVEAQDNTAPAQAAGIRLLQSIGHFTSLLPGWGICSEAINMWGKWFCIC